jgi:hypothetical protein
LRALNELWSERRGTGGLRSAGGAAAGAGAERAGPVRSWRARAPRQVRAPRQPRAVCSRATYDVEERLDARRAGEGARRLAQGRGRCTLRVLAGDRAEGGEERARVRPASSARHRGENACATAAARRRHRRTRLRTSARWDSLGGDDRWCEVSDSGTQSSALQPMSRRMAPCARHWAVRAVHEVTSGHARLSHTGKLLPTTAV